MLRLRHNDIGGAVVRKVFSRGGEYLRAGTNLSRDEVLAIPAANREALIAKNFMEVYPRAAVREPEPMDRHLVSCGFGKYDVIEGRKLNPEPLTKPDAAALAGIELQPEATRKRKN